MKKSREGLWCGIFWMMATAALPFLFPTQSVHAQGYEVAPGVHMDLEWRGRAEARENRDFNSAWDDEESGYLNRVRLGVTARLGPGVFAYLQGQDARRTGGLRTVQRAQGVTTLHQAYLDLPGFLDPHISLRVGRQEISLGEGRLVSPSNWSNLGRVFEAGRITYRNAGYALDLLSGWLVRDDYMPPGTPAQLLHGFYLTWEGAAAKEIYSLLKVRGGTLYTFGGRVCTPAVPGRMDWMLEAAYQTGKLFSRSRSASAAVASVGYSVPRRWNPRLGIEYAYASGDDDPNDNKVNTFDPLYGTRHEIHGIIDYCAWRNLRDLRLWASAEPLEKLALSLDYHLFRLSSSRDAWYNAPEAAGGLQDPTGAAGTDVGQEVDLVARYSLSRRVALSAGYAHFFAGSFIQRVQGRASDSDWGYVQATVTF